MLCGACGVETDPGSTTCTNCGAVVTPSANRPSGASGSAQGPEPGSPWAGYPGYPGSSPGGGWSYPNYPVGSNPTKSYNLDGLSSALAVMLGISAVASVVGALFEPVVVVMFLLLLPLIVMFPMWFYRARHNATSSAQGSYSSTYMLAFGGTVASRLCAAAAAALLRVIVKRVSAGPVGRVGQLPATARWQPGTPPPGSG